MAQVLIVSLGIDGCSAIIKEVMTVIRRYSFWRWAVVIVMVASLVIVPTIGSSANLKSEWRLGGQNLNNPRYQATEKYLSPANVSKLSPKWVFTTGGDVSATPAVVDGAAYLPDWGGNLFKIDAETGEQIWSIVSLTTSTIQVSK